MHREVAIGKEQDSANSAPGPQGSRVVPALGHSGSPSGSFPGRVSGFEEWVSPQLAEQGE